MISASRRLWRTSPATYVALVIAVLLSVYPFYYMFVIATRSLDSINSVPPPFTPGGSFGDNLRRVLDNDQANFQPLIPPHTTADIRIGGEWKNYTWSFAVQNLFDVHYYDYGVASSFTYGTYNAYPLPGRTWLARGSVKF